MKIAHIITRLILGGAQENTMLTVLGQQARGHEVVLLSGPTTGPEGTIVPLLRQGGATVIEVPDLVRPLAPRREVRATRQIRAALRDFNPDVVHTHSSKAGVLGRLAAHREGVPVIVHTIHGLPFHPYQSHLRNALYIRAERFAARHCHRIVSVADAMTAQALAAGVGRPAQYRTVYSGMEVEPFLRRDHDVAALRRRWGLPPGAFVIGKIARLFELKGHEYLLEAFARLAPQHPQLHLFFVGNGVWLSRFIDWAREHDLSDRITFAGLVPRTDLPAAIAAMDAVAHCSLREGLARVLPQALLSEKPVISFDVDGAREVVLDGRTGALIPPRDMTALTAAVANLLRDPETARAQARAGRDLCRERFDHQVMVDALLALYAEAQAR